MVNYRPQKSDSTMTSPQICSANFKINSQASNQKVMAGVTVALQAEDMTATAYQWSVICAALEGDYTLSGETQPQAMLALKAPGTYIVQLKLSRDQCQDLTRRIIWAVTPQQKYRLPATGEPLRFTGDETWAGDLLQVIGDIEDYLPTPDQKAALDAANDPRLGNPLATIADLGLTRIVAAGVVDLGLNLKQVRVSSPVTCQGGLRLISNEISSGLATLTFDQYDVSQADHYLVSALPVNEQAGQPTQAVINVQFVKFIAQGFVMQMIDLATLPVGRPALGRCMITVSQMMNPTQ